MQPFIKYLAELISEDADLNSSGGLIYEMDTRQRDLERRAASGDPEAAEALKIYLKRSGQETLTFEEMFDKYCEIIGFRPEGFNAFTEEELELPGPIGVDWPTYFAERMIRRDGRTSELYEKLKANQEEFRKEMIAWLQNQYINPKIIKGLAKLIESIWFQREYLDGKMHTLGPNGYNVEDAVNGYVQRRQPIIDKLQNRVERILGHTQSISPAGYTNRTAYWDTMPNPYQSSE